MERRKRNEAFAKLIMTQPDYNDHGVDSAECKEFDQETPKFSRANSVRASLRRLRGKLNTPKAALPSPFKLRGALNINFRSKQINKQQQYAKKKTPSSDNKGKAIQMFQSCNDLSSVAVITAKRKTTNEFQFQNNHNNNNNNIFYKTTTKMTNNNNNNNNNKHKDNIVGIEQLMSGLPVGSVPRKACKLLQIPETYCYKYLQEISKQKLSQQQPQQETKNSKDKDSVEGRNKEKIMKMNVKRNMSENGLLLDVMSENRGDIDAEDEDRGYLLCSTASQGIYGSTRMRTATIRKPVPYLNSSRSQY